MFGWVIVSRQLHFHIYYLFVGLHGVLQLKYLRQTSMETFPAPLAVVSETGFIIDHQDDLSDQGLL
jgi:hypothetical protein